MTRWEKPTLIGRFALLGDVGGCFIDCGGAVFRTLAVRICIGNQQWVEHPADNGGSDTEHNYHGLSFGRLNECGRCMALTADLAWMANMAMVVWALRGCSAAEKRWGGRRRKREAMKKKGPGQKWHFTIFLDPSYFDKNIICDVYRTK